MRKILHYKGWILWIMILFIIPACSKKSSAPSPATIPVVANVVKAKLQTWQQTIETTGTLNAMESVTITPEISGRITKIFFKSGQYVHEGTPLLLIYPEIIKAKLNKARANLKLAQLNYNRFLKLYQKHFYSRSALDSAKATLDADRADVYQGKASLLQTVVMAPFNGKLGLRKVSPGDYISAGQEITNLQETDPIRADFSLSEIYLPLLKIGNTITITSPAFTTHEKYTGKIYAMNAKVDADTRMIDVRAKITNPQQKLIPGTFIKIRIYLGQSKSVIMIPQTTVNYATDGNYVYKIINHKAVKTVVTLGNKLSNDQVIVKSGLKTNDNIVDGSQVKVYEGATIIPATAQTTPKNKKQSVAATTKTTAKD